MDNGVDAASGGRHQFEEPRPASAATGVPVEEDVQPPLPHVGGGKEDQLVEPREEVVDLKATDVPVDAQIETQGGVLEAPDGFFSGKSESLDEGNGGNGMVIEVQELGVPDEVDGDNAAVKVGEDGKKEAVSLVLNSTEVVQVDVLDSGEVIDGNLNGVKPDGSFSVEHQGPEQGGVHDVEQQMEGLELDGTDGGSNMRPENGEALMVESDKIEVDEMEEQKPEVAMGGLDVSNHKVVDNGEIPLELESSRLDTTNHREPENEEAQVKLELDGLGVSSQKEPEVGETLVINDSSTHLPVLRSEQNKDAPSTEAPVDGDVADGGSEEHLEDDTIVEALMQYVKEAVLAGRGGEHLDNSREVITVSDSKPAVAVQSASESVIVEELYDSSSSGDDDKVTPSHPAPPATDSRADSTGGPTLPARPAGLGSSAPLLEPSARSLPLSRPNGPATPPSQNQQAIDVASNDMEENDETHEKLQMIRVKFLRLAHRLGQTPHNVVVAQVLYRLGLAEQLRRNTTRPGVFSFDRAREMAEQLEAAGNVPLDFCCTIMVIGKSGVGKSATINSIFGDVKLQTNAFELSTRKVQEIVGMVQGIKVKVIDTPGLSPASSDQRRNEKVLRSVKRLISKTPPDIVLYFDRLDMQSRDYGDVPLLRTITDMFGASIWFNAIIVLTHAASAPPDGPNGIPLSYEMFVTQRSHVVQQAIRQAAGDVRLMNPVSLVENHSACRINRAGQRVLPNGQVWKPQLLLLSFASKILAEANALLKLQDSPPGKPFRTRVPPLPFLLSSLLQSRAPLKLPEEQFGDDDSLEDDLVEESDSDDGSDYDELPPFKCLAKSQLEKLNRAQKKAYIEELDYREKLFYKKQLKEERKRQKVMKKMAAEASDRADDFINENTEDENSGPASIPVPMPDMVLPSSFDSDNPSHRYRFLDSSSQWLVRPVLETQGWDHDVGYEGLNVERLFAVKDKVPLSVSGQLTKDKKECTLQMEVASSIKHGEGKTTSLSLDLQSLGKDVAYTIRGESRFRNLRRNSTAAGVSVTLLGDSMSTGMKIEDKLIINKQLRVLFSGGAMTGRGDVAYGGRLEATLRDKDYPIGQMLSTLALSVVDWHGDLAVGCNIQSQIPMGRGTNVIGHANLSNKGTGQVGIRLNSSEYLQIALIALVPIFGNIKKMLLSYSQSM